MCVKKGCFPPPCGPESLCTLLDEESVARLCHGPVNGPAADDRQFQYYVIDGTTIVGLLEKTVSPETGVFQYSLLLALILVCLLQTSDVQTVPALLLLVDLVRVSEGRIQNSHMYGIAKHWHWFNHFVFADRCCCSLFHHVYRES